MRSAFHPSFGPLCALGVLACSAVLAAAGAREAGVQAAPTPAAGGASSAPRSVVVTTGMVADLARSVLGDGSEVRALMGPGVDPHLYKPTRDDVARILSADLVVVNGLMLEGKMGDVLTRAGQGRWVISVGDLVPTDRVLHPEGAEAHPDPHIWMDPSLWALATDRFADAIAAKSGADAEPLRARARAYATELRGVDTWAKEVMDTIPQSQRLLITSHDAFAYLGRAYGLRVEGVQGLSTESEPGLRRIRELVDLIVENKLPAVFVESSVPRKSIEALIEGARAKGHKVEIGGELFSDALGPVGTWEGTVPGMVDHNVTTIVRALGGTAPQRGWKGKLASSDAGGAQPKEAVAPDATTPKDGR